MNALPKDIDPGEQKSAGADVGRGGAGGAAAAAAAAAAAEA